MSVRLMSVRQWHWGSGILLNRCQSCWGCCVAGIGCCHGRKSSSSAKALALSQKAANHFSRHFSVTLHWLATLRCRILTFFEINWSESDKFCHLTEKISVAKFKTSVTSRFNKKSMNYSKVIPDIERTADFVKCTIFFPDCQEICVNFNFKENAVQLMAVRSHQFYSNTAWFSTIQHDSAWFAILSRKTICGTIS
jgi:hypothetical protein